MATAVKRILVGVDGSETARRAIVWAVALAERFDAEIVAVHAVGLLAHLGEGPPVPSHAHLEDLRRAFEDEWCSPVQASGVAHRVLMREGSPPMVLLDLAQSEGVDMVVVGSRGAGGVAELLLGSTSRQVAEHADRPVLIVPPAAG